MYIGYIQNNEDKTEKARQYQAVQSFAKEQELKLDCVYSDYSFADIKDVVLSDRVGIGALIKKRLAGREEEIRKLLAQKVTKAEIARRFNVTRNTVFRFVKRNGLEEKEL